MTYDTPLAIHGLQVTVAHEYDLFASILFVVYSVTCEILYSCLFIHACVALFVTGNLLCKANVALSNISGA
jgi:hypothetical protein